MTPPLETERLRLWPLDMDDAPAIQRRFPRWEVVRHMGMQIPWPYPDDGAETACRMFTDEMARGLKHHWSLRLKSDPDTLIGVISLWRREGERDNRGFWLDPDHWGRGLMTEAADRVTDYAFRDLGWPELWFTNSQANVRSARVKERQGATLAYSEPATYVGGPGVRQVWVLKASDWLARR